LNGVLSRAARWGQVIGGYPVSTLLRPRTLAATIYEELESRPDPIINDRLAHPLNCVPANNSYSCTA
jgi:hypothetical protein